MEKTLYFIALLPNSEIQTEVTQFKQYAATHFATSRALRSPPHITLIPPFKYPTTSIGMLQKALKAFRHPTKKILIGLDGFDCFAPRVIFVDILPNKDLSQLQRKLAQYLNSTLNLPTESRPFHPHMTVAFKDLSKKQFPHAWAYFSKQRYERYFEANALTLLKHNGHIWEAFERYPLK